MEGRIYLTRSDLSDFTHSSPPWIIIDITAIGEQTCHVFPWKSGQKRFRCRNFWTCKASPEWLCYAQVGAKARGTAVPGLGLTQSDVCDSYQIAPDKLCLLGLDTSWNFIDIQLHCHGLTISLCVKIAAVWLDQLRKTA